MQLYYASNLLYLCAINLSKISIVLFLRRLTAHGTKVRRYTEILFAAISISMVAFLFSAGFQCGPRRPWAIADQECTDWVRLPQPFKCGEHSTDEDQFIGWEVQAIVASVTELGIFAAPVWLLWHLQKSRKFRLEILAWFSIRLLCVIPFRR